VSTISDPGDRQTPGETIGALLASAGLFVGLVALAYRPARLAPAAAVLVLTATAMAGGRYRRLVIAAVVAVAIGWFGGMTIAVVTNNPIF
jgi:hypothetical protein